MDKLIYMIYQIAKKNKYNYQRNPHEIFKELLISQYWSKETIYNYQINELNKLLQISKDSSSYYQKILKSIDLPFKEINEYNKMMPVLTKNLLKSEYDKIKTNKYCGDFKHSTSGTTGYPLTIYPSGLAESYRIAGYLRFLSWWGIKPYDKYVRIVGRRATIKNVNIKEKLLEKLRLRYDINIFTLGSDTIIKHVEEIRKFKPIYISGYKSGIYQFAELLEKKGLTNNDFKLKLAIVTAEVLLPEEKKYIEKILKCKVANEYGSADAGQFAFECPNGSMHIFEEAVYLNTNAKNELLVTELHNDSMPLINYKNDDKVLLSDQKCSCRRNSRILLDIEGRVDDYLIKPNGEKVNQIFFIFMIMELDDIGYDNSILKWKIVQSQNKFQVMIVPKEKYNQNVQNYIRKRLYDELGTDILIEFILVDSIPREKSGKLKLVSRIE